MNREIGSGHLLVFFVTSSYSVSLICFPCHICILYCECSTVSRETKCGKVKYANHVRTTNGPEGYIVGSRYEEVHSSKGKENQRDCQNPT